MKKYTLYSVLLSVGLLFFGCKIPKQNSTERPNVIFIYTDDLGWGDVSAYGGEIPTPNIDKLADYGVLHHNAYATAATCTPSRYALLTGQYAWRKKGRGVVNGDAAALIRSGEQSVATIFKKAGYQTAVIGKWHLGLGDENGVNWNGTISNTPNDIGFDKSFIMPSTSDRVPCIYVDGRKAVNLQENDSIFISYSKKIGDWATGKENPNQLKINYSHGHDMTIINGISRIGFQYGGKSALWKDENIADDFVRESKKFIIENKEKPFFLYLATNNIHVPRMPHPRFQGKTKQGLRGDAILELDDMVKSVMQTLDSLQLTEKTIVIFSSDNGAVLDDGYADQAIEKKGNHNPFGAFRGGKYSAYEGGTRVPMIVSWKNHIKKKVSKTPISQVDFIGSMAGMLGAELDTKQALDTENQWNSWIGKTDSGRQIIVQEAIQNVLSVVKNGYKYIEPTQSKMKTAWQTGIETGFSEKPQLFHLEKDLQERKNIATENPKIVKELQTELEKIKNKK